MPNLQLKDVLSLTKDNLLHELVYLRCSMKNEHISCNVKNRSVFCSDNLDILRNINSDCIDLIYLDPPFNKKKVFTASIGSIAEGASFLDVFKEKDVKEEWIQTIKEDNPDLYELLMSLKKWGDRSNSSYNFAYLAYMAIRLLEMRRILKDTGSLYLHCDPTMSHYLKLLLDIIFSEKNFRNEIVWNRTGSRGKGSQYASKSWGTNTDIILFYSKSDNFSLHPYKGIEENDISKRFPYENEKGERYYTGIPLWCQPSMGDRPNLCYEWRGFKNPHPSGWRLSKERIEEEYQKGNIVIRKDGKLERRKYQKDYKGEPVDNIWADIKIASGKERTGYPTQKPLELLERIISASSNKGDIVLDPFCGCATTCVAAEGLERKWVGIDVSIKAYELVQQRLKEGIEKRYGLLYNSKPVFFRDPPRRTDSGTTEVEKKYVYIISNVAYPSEYKVGIAKDWQARLNAYQTSDLNKGYKLEHKLHTQYFRVIEKHIHKIFESKHEWIQAKLKEIKREIFSYHKKLSEK